MNYDKYQFVLDWDDIPEDFKEEKITGYIEKGGKRACEECDGIGSTLIQASQEAGEIKDEETQTCSHCGGSGKVDPDLEDLYQREEAEQQIMEIKEQSVDQKKI